MKNAKWVPGKGNRNGDTAFVDIFIDTVARVKAWEYRRVLLLDRAKGKKRYKSRTWRRVEVRTGKRKAGGCPRALRTQWWLESMSFL